MARIDPAARQRELEARGAYDVDMNEQHRTFDAQAIDGGYEYLSRTPVERVRRAVVLSVVRVVGPLLTWFGQGAYTVGRKNLRALRGQGAISVCNHAHMLDTLLVKNALGPFRVYHTGSYYLLKRGELGRIFKSGGFLPVGTTVSDIKNLQLAVGVLMEKHKIVNFYPEHLPLRRQVRRARAAAVYRISPDPPAQVSAPEKEGRAAHPARRVSAAGRFGTRAHAGAVGRSIPLHEGIRRRAVRPPRGLERAVGALHGRKCKM